jgi:hypothetical protein
MATLNTLEWARMGFLISAAEIFSPPRLIMSFSRPSTHDLELGGVGKMACRPVQKGAFDRRSPQIRLVFDFEKAREKDLAGDRFVPADGDVVGGQVSLRAS